MKESRIEKGDPHPSRLPIAVDEGHLSRFRSVLSNSSSNSNLSFGYDFKFGFVGVFMSLLQRRRGTTEGGG